MQLNRKYAIPLILFAGAFLLFVLYALRGLAEPSLLMRIDSATYLAPARSLLSDFTYSSASGVPTALRVPLYPLLLAVALAVSGKSLLFCILMNCAVSALAVPVLYQAVLEFTEKRRTALIAALLLMFSPTEIAFAPMFLSEGMFVTLVSLELLFFLRFVRTRKNGQLRLSAAAGAAGADAQQVADHSGGGADASAERAVDPPLYLRVLLCSGNGKTACSAGGNRGSSLSPNPRPVDHPEPSYRFGMADRRSRCRFAPSQRFGRGEPRQPDSRTVLPGAIRDRV